MGQCAECLTSDIKGFRVHDESKRDVAFPLAVALGARVAFSLFAAFSTLLNPRPLDAELLEFYAGVKPLEAVGLNVLTAPFQRWDAIWYQVVVERGYSAKDATAAYFPLYPLLVRALTVLISDSVFAGILVTTIAIALSLIIFYHLTKTEFGDAAARRATLAWVVFPTSFYFFAPYAESLFVLCALLCLYYAQRGRWWLAGLAGGLASLTRSPGVLLFIPLLFAWANWHLRKPERIRWREIATNGIALMLTPLGLAAYMLYLYLAFGDPFLWQSALAPWQWTTNWPWQPVIATLDALRTGRVGWIQNLVDLSTTVFLFVIIITNLVTREATSRKLKFRIAPSFFIYAIVFLLAPLTLSAHAQEINLLPMYAAGRRAIVVFPAFLLIGNWLEGRWRQPLYFMLSLSFELLLLYAFTHWWWID